jgi:hypothetical protein
MTTSQRLAWWRAYATVLAILGGLCLAHFAPLPFAWRIGAQLTMLLVIYVERRRRTGGRPAARTAPKFDIDDEQHGKLCPDAPREGKRGEVR